MAFRDSRDASPATDPFGELTGMAIGQLVGHAAPRARSCWSSAAPKMRTAAGGSSDPADQAAPGTPMRYVTPTGRPASAPICHW